MPDRPLYRKVLPDGRIVEVWQQIYNTHLTVTLPELDGVAYEDDW